jgi:aryl-alcohol dehydrogenase-like predicted oxidoreductase
MLAGRYNVDKPFPNGLRAATNPKGIYVHRANRRGLQVAARVPEITADYGLTPGQPSLLWVKDQPGSPRRRSDRIRLSLAGV